jgi:hypothetical protein
MAYGPLSRRNNAWHSFATLQPSQPILDAFEAQGLPVKVCQLSLHRTRVVPPRHMTGNRFIYLAFGQAERD